MKKLILILIIFLTACGNSEDAAQEANIFQNIAEDSYGKFEGTVGKTDKHNIEIEFKEFSIKVLKDTEILNLENLEFQSFDVKEGDKIIAFIKVEPLHEKSKIVPELLALNNNPEYDIEMDKFHRVENFLLSTNNRIKVEDRFNNSQIRNFNGEKYRGDSNLKNYLIIYRGVEKGMPPTAKIPVIVKLPEDEEINFTSELFADLSDDFAKKEKAQLLEELLKEPKRFVNKEFDYFPLRMIFNEAGMQVNWNDEEEKIEIIKDSDSVILDPKTKKFYYGGKEYEIESLVSEYGIIYAPRELFEEVFTLIDL